MSVQSLPSERRIGSQIVAMSVPPEYQFTVGDHSHAEACHALSLATNERRTHAADIVRVMSPSAASCFALANEMNEIRPHDAGAERTLEQAWCWAVSTEVLTQSELLDASIRAPEDFAGAIVDHAPAHVGVPA